jgi:hypothetical protein
MVMAQESWYHLPTGQIAGGHQVTIKICIMWDEQENTVQ